jgi:twitching motility protein PilT
MELELQWFIALAAEELVDLETCQQIREMVGDDADMGTYAQTMLDAFADQVGEEELEQLLGQIQGVMAEAQGHAETGEVPPMFADEEAAAGGLSLAMPQSAQAPQGLALSANQVEEEEPQSIGLSLGHPGAADDDDELQDVSNVLEAPEDFDGDPIAMIPQVSSLDDEELYSMMVALLLKLRDAGASDLHLSAEAVPFCRQNLNITPLGEELLPEADAFRLNTILLSEAQRAQFKEDQDLNFALQIGNDRFRICLLEHKDGTAGSYRLVAEKLQSLGELGFLPTDVKTLEQMLDYHNGLILVTGPLGSGKTTTLASMVNVLNNKRHDHVITVEDPIEIVQKSINCNVTQRQIGRDTDSYNAALKGALREDPDIIVIGELHDLETIEMSITASETGHLVIGTLHTGNAASTLNRLLDVFPPSQQPQIRAMTAGSLRGIVCQKLVPAKAGGVTLCYEVLVNTMAVANIIGDGKTFQLPAIMQTGVKQGMCTFDQNAFNLYNVGRITEEVARTMILDKGVLHEFDRVAAVNNAQAFAASGEAPPPQPVAEEQAGDGEEEEVADETKKKKRGFFGR